MDYLLRVIKMKNIIKLVYTIRLFDLVVNNITNTCSPKLSAIFVGQFSYVTIMRTPVYKEITWAIVVCSQ